MNGRIPDFQYRMIKTALNILAKIPCRQMIRLATPLGKIWYGLDHYHRGIALKNMTSAFGREKKASEIKRMVKANFIQLVRVTLEIPSLLKLNRHNVDLYSEFVGSENLEKARAKGRGVLILTAHQGNWELMALAASLKLNLGLNILVRPIDFAPFDRVLTEIRSRTGNTVLDKDKSAGIITQKLSENQLIGILLDQNSSWYEGVYVPFFGKTACTNKGLAMFALRYDATVIPAFNIRQQDGRYRVMIGPPLELVRTGNISSDIVENTALFNTIIEKYIRMAPDNWFWVHRRWRIKEIPERARKKVRGLPV